MEEYNSDFRFQMKEFQEGNMLFEIMERNVWGKAATDSDALLKYYKNNAVKYKWGKSADVLIFNSSDISTSEKAFSAIKAGESWRQLAEKYASIIQVDSGRYELTQIMSPGVIANPEAGNFSSLIKNSDGTSSFVKFIKLYPGGEQRSFDEAKGLVINDYQIVLEDNWVKELRKKYPVTYNYVVLKTLTAK